MRLFDDEQAKAEIEKLTKRANVFLANGDPIENMGKPYYKSLCTRIKRIKSGVHSNKIRIPK